MRGRASWRRGLWKTGRLSRSTVGLTPGPVDTCGKREILPERLQEVVDECVEISVALSHVFDLPDGMNHRGMVLAAVAAADLRQRGVRQLLAQIHRDLTRDRDRLRVVARLQVHDLQLVVVGVEFL